MRSVFRGTFAGSDVLCMAGEGETATRGVELGVRA